MVAQKEVNIEKIACTKQTHQLSGVAKPGDYHKNNQAYHLKLSRVRVYCREKDLDRAQAWSPNVFSLKIKHTLKPKAYRTYVLFLAAI